MTLSGLFVMSLSLHSSALGGRCGGFFLVILYHDCVVNRKIKIYRNSAFFIVNICNSAVTLSTVGMWDRRGRAGGSQPLKIKS